MHWMWAGYALGVVTAENELLHHVGDAFAAETPVDDRVLVLLRQTTAPTCLLF